MCKIKQLNGDAPRMNNYCTAREYEVLTIIAKNEELKVGDLIDGEKLSNKTVGRIWEITECNRVDGGHVTIKDNKGNVKTCMFVFGKGTQKPKPQQTTKEETTKTDETMNTTTNSAQGNGIEQVANIFASLQSEAYRNGCKGGKCYCKFGKKTVTGSTCTHIFVEVVKIKHLVRQLSK